MIFLDANCFLRLFETPTSLAIERMQQQAAELFQLIDANLVAATTSAAILAEVAFIMTAKRHQNMPIALASHGLSEVVRMPGLRISAQERRQWLAALETWEAYPAIGFVDALTYAISADQGHQLATFDRDFARFPDVDYYWAAE